MPTVMDATVVNQAYDTLGNGGRKLVRLSNGWLVTGAKTGSGTSQIVYLYKSTDNGQTWSQLCYIQHGTGSNQIDFSFATKGNTLYILSPNLDSNVFFYKVDVENQTNENIYPNRITIDSGQNYMGNGSLTINEAGTELHAAWASKNSTYPNSFNIRYVKGTINADGSVTWGAVQQITVLNSSNYDLHNPSIVIKNNQPFIFVDSTCYFMSAFTWSNAGKGIFVITNTTSLYTTQPGIVTNGWSVGAVYQVSSNYYQSSPSACVDKNGRIWVAWHGTDSTDTTRYNIRVSYSDDGGQTWSAHTKLTSGNTYDYSFPSITVNKNNEVFVLFYGRDATDGYSDIRMIKYSSGSWGSISIVSNGTTSHKDMPSALYDVTIDFSIPLFIYRDQGGKVGFCGTWIVTTISVTPGYIGQKTSSDKSNILSYSITTDGTMSTITEKINGVTIATRTNPINEQEFTVSLSQEQWDAIKYGNGHTLTIEMDSDKWTYTFDKRLNANDDILSAVKGVQDLQDHLNAVKAQLGSAIRAKGGTVNDTDAWSSFVSAVNNIIPKKSATGTISFMNTNVSVTINNLTFAPTLVLVKASSGRLGTFRNVTEKISSGTEQQIFLNVTETKANSLNSTGFTITNYDSSYTVSNLQWWAYEL